jgi:xanthine dehydrogenase/oxidase
MAMYQAQGEVRYTHEQRPTYGTLFGTLVVSPIAAGRFDLISGPDGAPMSFDALRDKLKRAHPSFVELVAADCLTTSQNMEGMAGDQPLFVPLKSNVMYQGQCLAMVLAASQASADDIAQQISEIHLTMTPTTPVVSLAKAVEDDLFFPDSPRSAYFISHIWKVKRNESDGDWAPAARIGQEGPEIGAATLDSARCLTVSSPQTCGGQLHF